MISILTTIKFYYTLQSINNYCRANATSNSVRHHLRDVKKGWFNVEESSLEVYNFSKIRKFMVRINFAAEDTLRDLCYKSTSGYCAMIGNFCPSEVKGKLVFYISCFIFCISYFIFNIYFLCIKV